MRGRATLGRVGCAGLAAALLCGAPARPAEPVRHALQTWELAPGTTAALVADPRAPLVTLRLEFPAGDWSPWTQRTRADEAFESLLLDRAGTLRRRADLLAADIRLVVGRRGAILRASFLRADLDAVVALVGDVLGNADLDRRELRRRGRSRRIDWRSRQKNPRFRAAQAAAFLLFAPGDPRRRPWERPLPAETNPRRLAAARDTLIRLPGRVVALAGDVTREDLQRTFAGWLPPVLDRPPGDLALALGPLAGPGDRDAELRVSMPRLTQVYFGRVRDSLTYEDPDYPAFLIADHVLGGHFYSRLYVALRHEGGETYGVSTTGSGDVARGHYTISSFTRAPNAGVAEAKLREALELFRARGISEDERAAAAGSLLGRLPFGRQSPEQVLDRFLHERSLGLPAGALERLTERAARTPLATVNAFIERWYDPAAFSTVRVEPSTGGP